MIIMQNDKISQKVVKGCNMPIEGIQMSVAQSDKNTSLPWAITTLTNILKTTSIIFWKTKNAPQSLSNLSFNGIDLCPA